MSEDRYARNMTMLSPEENNRLRTLRACVVGCGGLGGYLIEMLGRLGIGTITAIDGDVFGVTNLNRQLLSCPANLGQNKARAAVERLAQINPQIKAVAIDQYLDERNGAAVLQGHDIILDALDNRQARFLLQDLAEQLQIPFVHGAVAGWYGRVTTVFPGDRTLSALYRNSSGKGLEQQMGTPSFTPALVASVQVSEAVKVLLHKGTPLRRKLLYIDLAANSFRVIELNPEQPANNS